MGTVRLTPELEEFIKGKSLVHESVDSTLRRLLGYEQSDETRVYVKRDSLMPRQILMAFILDAFFEAGKSYENPRVSATPKALRDWVNIQMDTIVNSEQWPRDFDLNSRNKQPRWKNRFSGMLQELIKKDVLIHHRLADQLDEHGVIQHNYKGGEYIINERGLGAFQNYMIEHSHKGDGLFTEPNVWATISEYHLEDQEVSSNPEENDIDFEADIRLFWSVSRLLNSYGLDKSGGTIPWKLNTAHFNEENQYINRASIWDGLSKRSWYDPAIGFNSDRSSDRKHAPIMRSILAAIKSAKEPAKPSDEAPN